MPVRLLRKRMLAVRAFDGLGMMLAFELVDGRALEQVIEKLFATPNAARVERA